MKKTIVIENAKSGQDKIGLVIEEDARIILPLYYLDNIESSCDITSLEKQKLKRLVKAWRKYQKRIENITIATDEVNKEFYNFDTALNIIEDFVNNGLYMEYEKIETYKRDGKIDFTKTIKKCKPIITNQGSIYLKYISHVKKVNDEEIIRNLQKIAVNSIAKEIGWLIGFNIQLPIENGVNVISKKSIYELNEARNSSFNSRKLKLIELLLKYIKSTGKENKAISSNLFVATAHHFWEAMVFKVFGNIHKTDINKIFYIRHTYKNINTNKNIKVLDPLKPDAIFMNSSNINVIDAKYYSRNNLPTNEDISKQFIYAAKAFKKYGNSYKYKNWFIIPTNSISEVSDYRVHFDRDINVGENNEYSPIQIFYANMEEVVSNYISNESMHSLLK